MYKNVNNKRLLLNHIGCVFRRPKLSLHMGGSPPLTPNWVLFQTSLSPATLPDVPDAGKTPLCAKHRLLQSHSSHTETTLLHPHHHSPTCAKVVAGLVHPALEELLPHDGVDDDHEEHQQGDVEQGHHGLDDGVQDHLKACTKREGEEVNHFLNSSGCTLYPCQPTNKQPLKCLLPGEEGHGWGGTEISEAGNAFFYPP